MISAMFFSLSALCLMAMFLPEKPSRPRQSLETYYVCGPESLSNPETEDALLAFAGSPRA